MRLFGVQIWPWKYSGKMYTIRWHYVRNAYNGLSLIINGHLWFTKDPDPTKWTTGYDC